MRIAIILPLAAALMLTACGDSAEEEGTSVVDVADEMADGAQPLPGQYTTTTELLEFNVPGLSEDMRAMMEAAMAEGAAEGTTYCLTPEDAANSREEMIKNMTESDCTVQRFDVSGDTIDAALSCPSGTDGISGDVTMNGTMGETGGNMEMSFKSQVPELGEATIRMRIISERVGDCT
jgi:hypothetical protein